jgi:hypothetical protein
MDVSLLLVSCDGPYAIDFKVTLKRPGGFSVKFVGDGKALATIGGMESGCGAEMGAACAGLPES